MPVDVLPVELREGVENLFINNENRGYVHTPSLNHATAAAILLNGYNSHATEEQDKMLAVNLSSERVRRAKYLIDGVRYGQTLEALLGYQFERGMHDWTTRVDKPVVLDTLKPNFRQAYPIKRTKIPRGGVASEPAEVVEEFSLVNGLDLARADGAFLSKVPGHGSFTADQNKALTQEGES